jgi:hypothetical protein
MVQEIPDTPTECPICQRVENTLKMCPLLRGKLSETELAELVREVQTAILNKEVKKTERGINMADEKYVISKASFEDFYETQDTLVSIMEKMVDRIEKQDQVILKLAGVTTELLAKDFGMPAEMPVPEADVVEEDVPFEEEEVSELDMAEEEMEESEEEEAEAEEDVEDVKEKIEGEVAGVEPVPEVAPPMMEEKLAAEKSAFEAGYKAALAEMQKKNGVEVTPLEVPTKTAARPVVPAATPVAKTVDNLDALPAKDLATMTPNQLNTWLREHKLYR